MTAILMLSWLEARRQLRQVAGLLSQPLMFLFALGFGLHPVFARAGEGSYIQFLAPGVIAMTVLLSGALSGIGFLRDRQFGFMQELLISPLPRSHIILGRALGGAAIATVQGLIVFAICLAAGFRPASWLSPLVAFLVLVLIAIAACGFGALVGCRARSMQSFPIIVNGLVMPLCFLSGAFFPLKDAPAPLLLVASSSPVSYAIDGLRGAFTGVAHLGMALDIGVVAAMGVILMALGAYSFSRLQV
jgi:ABC-2 type transport system permease protein